MIAAILRAQILSMRIGARRGAVFGIITGILWYGIWFAAAVIAYSMASAAPGPAMARYLPLGFLAVCVYWQLVPVVSASMGAGIEMQKLRVYPIPHGKLFLVEVLLRFTTGAEMVLLLAGGTIGLLSNPAIGRGAGGALRILLAVSIFAVFNVLLASGTRSLLERLLSRRKIREALSFFLLLLYVIPRMLFQTGTAPRSLGPLRVLRTMGLPWTAAARSSVPDHASQALPALLSLAAWTVAAFWFGRFQFERNLRYDAVAAQATPLQATGSQWQVWTERFYRWPSLLLPDPVASVVEKELRSLMRTPRFRMVFVMGFTFGLMAWYPLIAGRHSNVPSQGGRYYLIAVCVYALTLLGQVTYWNCLGFDRSAAILYFTAPQPFSRVLLGKNLASLFFVYLEVSVLTIVTVALGLGGGVYQVAETLGVVGVCALYMLSLGNISSVQYPRALTPERVSQGGASGRFQGLIFLVYPLALLPVGLAYLARYAFDSDKLFLLVMLAAAIGGMVFYQQAMQSAVRTATGRREEIMRELSKGDGPVTGE